MEAIDVISIMDKGVIICGISLMVGDREREGEWKIDHHLEFY